MNFLITIGLLALAFGQQRPESVYSTSEYLKFHGY